MVRLMEDHMGFDSANLDGVNTPEIEQADNDYAVAKLIEKVANSPYKSDTLIFILEDDSQNGADHVDFAPVNRVRGRTVCEARRRDIGEIHHGQHA